MTRFKRLIIALLSLLCVTAASADAMFEDMNGKTTLFSDLQGKWVLINYWASWCKTCIEEIPQINHFYKNHKNNDLALFAVNYDALPLEKQQKLIRKLNILYPSLKEDPSMELELGDIRGLPATFIFNPQGQLSMTLYGGQTVKSLEELFLKLKSSENSQLY